MYKNILKYSVHFGILLLLIGCSFNAKDSKSSAVKDVKWNENDYAKNFFWKSLADSVFLKIASPHDSGLFSVYRLPKYKATDLALSNSVQWAFLRLLLDPTELPGAVSGHQYFCDDRIHKAIKAKQVKELQGSESIDEEALILSGCTIILQDGFNSKQEKQDKHPFYNRLYILEWQEKHPLARLEWIKVFGALLGREQKALSLFNKKKEAYENAVKRYSSTGINCKVMASAPFKDEWFVPAKDSYMERLIRDAGGVLLNSTEQSHVSQKLSLEEAYLNFKDADVWLLNAGIESKNQLRSAIPFYDSLKAVTSDKIYNYHKLKSHGNYAFWERGVCEPEQLLLEYHQIFSGALNQSVYYAKVE